MAKKLKESQPCSIRMDKIVFERLCKFCEVSGQSKTTAIERALLMYIDDYDKKMLKLNENKEKNHG